MKNLTKALAAIMLTVATLFVAGCEREDSIQPIVEGTEFWVDLGLPSGLQWATCNVGASSPEDYGDYFAWGETTPKEGYSWGNYLWMTKGKDDWSWIRKYTFADEQTDGCWYSGETFIGDNKKELELSDDAASVNWGSGWRMPSQEQLKELIDPNNTTTVWTTEEGIAGLKITSVRNSNSIFLPATGYFGSSGTGNVGTSGNYWSRTLGTSFSDHAFELFIKQGQILCYAGNRYVGQSVRPVRTEGGIPIKLVTSIELNYTSLTMKLNETQQLTATVKPSNADNKTVAWESSNTSVATVSTDGLVTAKAEGSCKVICRATDGSGVKAECNVKVNVPKLVTSIVLNYSSLTMVINDFESLIATVYPSDADNQTLTWESSNSSVVAIDYVDDFYCGIIAKAEGSCKITCRAKDGSGVKAECNVIVVNKPKLVTSIELNYTSLTIEPNKTKQLRATVEPSDADNKTVTWESSNTSVATVSTNGLVTAKTKGSCKVTCRAKDGSGVKAECQITVGTLSLQGHTFVEIGGKKWATMNVGATTVAGDYATCCGDYYAWGEIETRYATMTRTGAYTATFTWKNGYENGHSSSNYPTYTGSTLDAGHDAATANWGDRWRTPTREDYRALIMSCSNSYDHIPSSLTNKITSGGIYWLSAEQTYEPKYTGVAGILFVEKDDISNRVFFPAAGYVENTILFDGGMYGTYWTSTLDTSDTKSFDLLFYSGDVTLYSDYRYYGYPVRPVSE